MYMNECGQIFFEPLPGNKSFNRDAFSIDTMMAPVVAVLLKKGYASRASCEGHVFTHTIMNVEECYDDPDEEYIAYEEEGFTPPYIMMEDDVRFPTDEYPIPETWTVEINTPRSSVFDPDGESDEELYTFEYSSDDKVPYNDFERGFNVVLRIDDSAFGDKIGFYGNEAMNKFFAHCKEDPYEAVYWPIMKAIHELYLWAKSLPENKKK